MKQYRIEAKKRCFSDVPGAVFVSQSTGDRGMYVWDAKKGLVKFKGCVEFMDATDYGYGKNFNVTAIKKKYYDFPNREEAWLVLPDGTGYLWIRIDDQIEFS